MSKRLSDLTSIGDVLKQKGILADKRNTYEFQAYGNRLAEEFGDVKHRSLYIKLAKTTDRNLLEQAREFVLKQENAKTKGKLFMWKLDLIKKEKYHCTNA